MKKSSITVSILVGIVIILLIIQAGVSNRLSVKGVLVSKIEDKINFYKTQNAILSEKLLSYSSLASLSLRASRLGFAKERTEVALGSSVSLAAKQ